MMCVLYTHTHTYPWIIHTLQCVERTHEQAVCTSLASHRTANRYFSKFCLDVNRLSYILFTQSIYCSYFGQVFNANKVDTDTACFFGSNRAQ